MKEFPPLPSPEDGSLSGHLWVLEWVDGGPLRFQVEASGAVRFAGRERTFDGDVPLPYQRAVSHVRNHLDRSALREAAENPADVTFFGVSTHRVGVEYDWAALPPFLGVEVWSSSRDRFVAPDVVKRVFRELGLSSLPVIEKEVDAAYLDVEGYSFPESEWSDGPVAGLLYRDKTGGRVLSRNDGVDAGDPVPEIGDADTAEALVDAYATPERFERVVGDLESHGWTVSHDAVFDRVITDIAREAAPVFEDGKEFDEGEFRSAVAERLQRYLGDH